jgi:hypothetical protein
MFGWLKKDPVKKLEQKYSARLEAARDLQRNGDLMGYSDAVAEAEEILRQIDALKAAESAH